MKRIILITLLTLAMTPAIAHIELGGGTLNNAEPLKISLAPLRGDWEWLVTCNAHPITASDTIVNASTTASAELIDYNNEPLLNNQVRMEAKGRWHFFEFFNLIPHAGTEIIFSETADSAIEIMCTAVPGHIINPK